MKQKTMFKILITTVIMSLALIGCEPMLSGLADPGDAISQAQNENTQMTEEEQETQEMQETEEEIEVESTAEVDFYHIEFVGKTDNEDGTSTWEYLVEEMEDAQDLSYWVLELPGCAQVVDATHEPFEIVAPDPNSELYGIKWELGSGFSSGTFSVTLNEQWEIDDRQIAFKGPEVHFAVIAGATCGEGFDDEDWDNDYWNFGYEDFNWNDNMNMNDNFNDNFNENFNENYNENFNENYNENFNDNMNENMNDNYNDNMNDNFNDD